MFLFIDRSKSMFGSAFSNDFEVKSTSGGSSDSCTDTGEDNLVYVGDFDEERGFGDEEDVFFEEE